MSLRVLSFPMSPLTSRRPLSHRSGFQSRPGVHSRPPPLPSPVSLASLQVNSAPRPVGPRVSTSVPTRCSSLPPGPRLPCGPTWGDVSGSGSPASSDQRLPAGGHVFCLWNLVSYSSLCLRPSGVFFYNSFLLLWGRICLALTRYLHRALLAPTPRYRPRRRVRVESLRTGLGPRPSAGPDGKTRAGTSRPPVLDAGRHPFF